MTYLAWHDLSGKAQALARTAMASLDHAEVRPQAQKDAEAMLDALWAMGLRPNGADACNLYHAKPPLELACRALCRFHSWPENAMFEGRPRWESYIVEAAAVLEAVSFDAIMNRTLSEIPLVVKPC